MSEDAEGEYMPIQAKMRGSKWRVEVRVRHVYDLEQAAAALAIVAEERATSRFGKKTIRAGLHEAAQRGLTADDPRLASVDEKLKAKYRDALLEYKVFPRESTEG